MFLKRILRCSQPVVAGRKESQEIILLRDVCVCETVHAGTEEHLLQREYEGVQQIQGVAEHSAAQEQSPQLKVRVAVPASSCSVTLSSHARERASHDGVSRQTIVASVQRQCMHTFLICTVFFTGPQSQDSCSEQDHRAAKLLACSQKCVLLWPRPCIFTH